MPMEIHRSALVSHSAAHMYTVIEAAEHYPHFVPWCREVEILERNDEVVVARIAIGYRNLSVHFTTRNRKRFPTWMSIGMEHGPFRSFEGEWQLRELDADGCRIDFRLRYELDSSAVARLAAPAMDRIASRLMHAFLARADAVSAPAEADAKVDLETQPTWTPNN